jgi:uncharacterized surface protein with fasciclin (FAS1) repeats
MKTRNQLLIGILGLSALISIPVLAQDNPVEDSVNGMPAPAEETVPLPTEETPPDSLDSPIEDGEMSEPAAEAESGNLVEQASSSEQFQTLTQAIEAAGIEEMLAGEGPYTVFAPTDEAFAELPPETLEQLLLPENKEALAQLLSYHVIPGAITSSEIQSGEVETLAGAPVFIEVSDEGMVTVNNATVTQADIPASNGVIHAVDQIVLPPEVQARLEAASESVSQRY